MLPHRLSWSMASRKGLMFVLTTLSVLFLRRFQKLGGDQRRLRKGGVTSPYSGKEQTATSPDSAASVPNRGATATPFTVPTISLPKGGRAIRGMGEKFAANPVTVTDSMTPLAISPRRSGFGPQLSRS